VTEAQRDLLAAYTAGYLALILRQARRWFFSSQADSYGQDQIIWSVNLGIPSAGYGDEYIRRAFCTIGEAAWVLSLESAEIRLDMASDGIEFVRNHAGGSGVALAVVPEVAAQVVGYARSSSREEGLHVLVDVGASTLDICSFLLRQDQGDDVYSLLTADVRRLGLLELHRRRMKAAQGRPPFHKVPDDIASPLPTWRSISWDNEKITRLLSCDSAFQKACMRALIRTLADLKKNRDPGSPRWNEGLPIFLGGGGIQSEVFAHFINDANREATKYWNMHGLLERRLPLRHIVGADGRGIPYEVFNRLTVAFGLSHDAINIGSIEAPAEVPDVERTTHIKEWRDFYVGKEHV
jgi:hypothetical protein